MNKGLLLSTLLHSTVVVTVWIGMPFFSRSALDIDIPIVVELVPVSEVTAAPLLEQKPEPEPESEPEQVAEPDSSSEATASVPPPPPEPEEEQLAALPTSPRVALPPRKPLPPKRDSFQDLVSLVKDLEQEVASRPTPETKPSDTTPAEGKIRTLQTADRATLSERDAIRAHIERCWRIDPGKEGIQELSVDLRVGINPDGSVRRAIIEDTGLYFTDPAFRTFADSARTAVLSCSNIPISPQRYEIFKEIVFTFSPQGRIN